MNRSKPRPPQTAPNVMNNELNACAVDLPGRQKHSDQFLFSRALAPLTFLEVKTFIQLFCSGAYAVSSVGLLLLSRGVAVFPSPFAMCCLSSCLLLGGAAWFSSIRWCCCFSLFSWVVLLVFLLLWVVLPSVSSFGWSCFAPLFGGVVLLGLLLLWVVLLFTSSLRWCCFPFPPLGHITFK